MNNNKTDIKYTWDLSKFYKSDAEWYADFKNAQSYVGKFLEFKGKLNNKVELKKYFDLNKEVSLLIDKLYMYASSNGNVDLDNAILKYSEAMKLAKFCSEKLKDATDKVNKILTENGELKEFNVE